MKESPPTKFKSTQKHQAGASKPFSLNPTGTLSRRHFAQFVSAIDISGFSAPEIDQILLGDDPPPHEQGPLAPAPGAIAVAREGDIFFLGEHKIACGDATAEDVFAALMRDDGPARLVLTDEPYNVRIAGNVTG